MIRMRYDILEEDMPPRRRFVLTAPPPGCDVAESSAAAARAPRGQYDFVDTVEAGQGLIRSPGHDARTIARAADRAEDVGYVRALQASEHRMMTSIEEVNLRVSYQAQVRRRESEDFYTQLLDARTDRRDIRLEIDVVRGQRTAYETELHEVRQAYLSSEARNRALLARLETLETHMSRMEWQRQSAEDLAVRQMMRTQVLEARARIDTVEDAGSSFIIIISICIDIVIISHVHCILVISRIMPDDASQSLGGGLRRPVQPARVCSYIDFMKCQPLNFKGTKGVVALPQWLENMESVFHISGCANDNQVKFATCTLLGAALTWGNDVAAYTQCFQELALIPKTLDDAIELANDLMDQKLSTYAERQNEKKRNAGASSRNNHQQQPHEKQIVAKAYTAGPGEKKAYTGNLPLCTKCNYHHIGQCAPKCRNYKRLYNLFDKFAYVPGETLYEYYWRFSQLINDMHTIGMTMQQVQVNTKFLNALPSEWSKFVTDVKLAKSLYTTNYDQLYAYLSQHKRHANEVRISRERYPDSLAFVANSPTLYNPSQSPQHLNYSMYPPPQQFTLVYAAPLHHQHHHTPQGEDPIECINKAMAILSAIALRFPPSNNQLRTSSNPRNQATIQDGNRGIATTLKGNVLVGPPRVVKCYNRQGEVHMARQCTQSKRPRNAAWFKEKLMLAEAQEACQILDEEQLAFLADPAKAVLMANLSSYDPEVLSEDTNPSAHNDLLMLSLVEQMSNHVAHLDKENQTNKMVDESLTAELERYKERIAIFKQRLNVDLNKREKLIDSQMDDLIRDRNAKFAAFQ
ncbi:hypothetical protein Tco_1030406 [Tanacetum coccineum]|uniref:Retrotransposon gag domain-containing protein n=1 Tax=Tanacetum coccineum TaxID=301880 RepID=A0ABQ5G650_9ASTR